MSEWESGAPPQQQGWWSRNWKWVVALGCLGPLLCCGCFGAVSTWFGWSAFQDTSVYLDAVATATRSPEVREALGEDVRGGMLMQGAFNMQGGGGTASFRAPLEGSRGQGTLRVEAVQENEQWRFTTLEVEVPGREPINLLQDTPGEPPPGTVPYPDGPPAPPEPAEPGDNHIEL